MIKRKTMIIAMSVSLLASWLILTSGGAENLQYRSSLEEATAIAARLALRQEDPVGMAIGEAQQARAALDAIDAGPLMFGQIETTYQASDVVIKGEYKTDDDEMEGEYEAAVERYAGSLQALGRFPRTSTLSALTPAASHYDTRVRLAALTALREGAVNDPQAPILNLVREMIVSDPNPEIRREAFEVYCRWGDQADVLSLAMYLGREASPVQDLAVREWIRIEKELQAQAEGTDDIQVQQALE